MHEVVVEHDRECGDAEVLCGEERHNAPSGGGEVWDASDDALHGIGSDIDAQVDVGELIGASGSRTTR